MLSAVVRGVLWFGGQRIASRLVNQAFSIVLLRLLLPRDYGLMAMASIVIGALNYLAFTSVNLAIVQRRDVDDDDLSTAFWANLVVGVTLFVLAAVSGGFLAALFGEPVLGLLVAALALRFIIEAGNLTQHSLLARGLHYRTLSVRFLAGIVAGGVTGVCMALAGLGVWSLVGETLVGSAVGTLTLYFATRWRPAPRFSWTKFKNLWSFGGRVWLSHLLGYLVRSMDNFLIGRALGSAALGLYSLGYTLARIPQLDLALPVNDVMFSAFARLQHDPLRLKRAYLMATEYLLLLILPVTAGMSLVAPELIEGLFGRKWLPASPVLTILALTGALEVITMMALSGVRAMGRADLQLRWAAIQICVYLPAFVVGLRWGIVGVAGACMTATVVLLPVPFLYMARVMGIRLVDVWRVARATVFATAVMMAVLIPLHRSLAAAGRPALIILEVTVLAGVLIYGATTWFLQRQSVLRVLELVRGVPASVGSYAAEVPRTS